jgi:hypothetical protein
MKKRSRQKDRGDSCWREEYPWPNNSVERVSAELLSAKRRRRSEFTFLSSPHHSTTYSNGSTRSARSAERSTRASRSRIGPPSSPPLPLVVAVASLSVPQAHSAPLLRLLFYVHCSPVYDRIGTGRLWARLPPIHPRSTSYRRFPPLATFIRARLQTIKR